MANEPVTASKTDPGHAESVTQPPSVKGNPWRTFSITLIVLIILAGVVYWVWTQFLFPGEFTPVELNQKEQQHLDQKLNRLEQSAAQQSASQPSPRATLEPEPYSESAASREIHFTEKELNALLARNTDLASKLAIDLADNLASANMLIDLDPDFPFIGGNTLKVAAGMELMLSNGQPKAILKGVSLWGVPMPNAWLGNMKNKDLIQEFGDVGGFWQAINEGVDHIEVKQGALYIRLKE